LTRERRNDEEVDAISNHFFYPSEAPPCKQVIQLFITLIGVLSS